ncbi:short-chain dehydrogenase [Flavobacterium akiainvivens]|uniref:Short-chain dehydrogenase n=1 Tax=Flavobacterium akiainvivens TaxID=1202724 RepID=A0A0M8MGI0_9FLAO|nr:SDR family oxidoreductase [Flavobacterium akiainvivens]KOS05761.1 short-chain dehydrogenase [Flavobacterium akiainvivens]SFQ77590.1 3-oxoacyl-[acyl-carrier protein] reductase [Flavobacterium akiainvivens]
MRISEAKVIITGGTTGIGYETAKLLKAQGAQVVICARNEDSVNKIATELDVYGIRADVTNEEDITNLFSYAIEKMNGLNILINNAGIGHSGSLLSTSVSDFALIWENNTKSVFMCGQKAAKIFIEQNYGNIINISSMGAVNGFPNGSAYCSSKSAITGLTLSWRSELRKHNIRVTQVNPSEVVTGFGEKSGHVTTAPENKLKGLEIAQVINSLLSLNDIAFVPEINVWATNPGS